MSLVNPKRLTDPNDLSVIKSVLINEDIDILLLDELNPERFNQVVKVMTYNEQVTLDTIRKWVTNDNEDLDTGKVESDSDDEDTVVNEDAVSDEDQLIESVTDDESICEDYHYINQNYFNKLVNSKEAANLQKQMTKNNMSLE